MPKWLFKVGFAWFLAGFVCVFILGLAIVTWFQFNNWFQIRFKERLDAGELRLIEIVTFISWLIISALMCLFVGYQFEKWLAGKASS